MPGGYVPWEPVGHLQGSLGPSGPRNPEKVKSLKQVSRGLRQGGPPRVWKKSGKSLESLEKVPKRLFRYFFQTLGGPRGRRPQETFSDFFGVSGPEGPRDPCKWPTGSQGTAFSFPDFLASEADRGGPLLKKGAGGFLRGWGGFARTLWNSLRSLTTPDDSLRPILEEMATRPRGPNDHKNLISIEIFNLTRNFRSRSKILISMSRFPPQK